MMLCTKILCCNEDDCTVLKTMRVLEPGRVIILTDRDSHAYLGPLLVVEQVNLRQKNNIYFINVINARGHCVNLACYDLNEFHMTLVE